MERSKRIADIGVIGGSGFYSFANDVEEIAIETPYGSPSDTVHLAKIGRRSVAFLPRHGRNHTIPPHLVNYRANIWALRYLGVRYLISPCAVGSLQGHIDPEHFVVLDQFVDRTWGRKDTYFEGPEVHHVSPATPYCPHLRRIALDVIRDQGIVAHDGGTIVVVNGPRFSTTAESHWFMSQGWSVVGMTQYPEAMLALEQQIACVGIALVTDRDCGLAHDGDIGPVTVNEVLAVFRRNVDRIRDVVVEMVKRIPPDLDSPSHHALHGAAI